jgi:hypothetical protein
MVGAPGEEPGLHVFVFDVMSRLDLTGTLPSLCQQSFLVGNIRFDGIGDEEIGTPT